MKRIPIAIAGAGVIALAALVGLASGSSNGYLTRTAGATKVKVTLAPRGDQSKLESSTSVARAGEVTFIVHNASDLAHGSTYGVPNTPEAHELVVLRTNAAPDKLRVDSTWGTAIETGRVGEPLAVDPGKTRTITLNLKPGKYVLICNFPGQYEAGQRVAFRVVSS